MGRAGRYTLAVMVWVATFAAWSGVVGLLVAAITGETRPDAEVAAGWSALFYVALSAVPTVAALVFNDWAREGFPTKEERRRAARAARAQTAEPAEPAEPAVPPVAEPVLSAPPALPTVGPAAAEEPPTLVPPVPLGVPEGGPDRPADGAYPVAPLLRDRQ